MRVSPRAFAVSVMLALCCQVHAQDTTLITVQTARPRQVFEGLGAGAIFFEEHITSLAARNKNDLQEQLYDDMFARVPTRYLQLMIRETHEPQNDNVDPFTPAFDDKNFGYCKHTIQIAKAALKRRPNIQFCATLYTPQPWMKTNNAASGGGQARATLKDGLELELAEYLWAFLAHMHKNGVPIQYLSIANEPDWPHTQPGYFLPPLPYAALFKTVAEYLDKMAKKYPDVPCPKLVGTFLLGAQAMVGQDPARFRRSTTATRFPCEASDQAKDLALPLPSTTTSYSSGCDTFFPLRVNSSRSFHALAATISLTTRNSGRTSRRRGFEWLGILHRPGLSTRTGRY